MVSTIDISLIKAAQYTPSQTNPPFDSWSSSPWWIPSPCLCIGQAPWIHTFCEHGRDPMPPMLKWGTVGNYLWHTMTTPTPETGKNETACRTLRNFTARRKALCSAADAEKQVERGWWQVSSAKIMLVTQTYTDKSLTLTWSRSLKQESRRTATRRPHVSKGHHHALPAKSCGPQSGSGPRTGSSLTPTVLQLELVSSIS